MSTTFWLIVSMPATAQFTNAVIANNVTSITSTPTILNNDILDDASRNCRVTAFSDATGSGSGIMWECFVGAPISGNCPLNYYSIYSKATVNYIDVSLVKDINTGDIHALTVYSVNSVLGNQWILEDFIWTGTAFVSNPSIPQWSIAYGNFGTTIHIDANTSGEFIVVYDDASNNVYHITGILAGGINLFGAITDSQNSTNPDVTISHDLSGNSYIYMTFINTGILTIQEDYFSVAIGFPILNPNSIFNSGIIVNRPRISSPNIYGGALEYEVVFECTNIARTYYEIRGYNSAAAIGYKYNIGTFVPGGNTTSVPNHHPVVSYDQNNFINVGWVLDNSSGAISGAYKSHYPIILPCDNLGNPIISTYWEMPTAGSNFGNSYNLPFIALSSRHSLINDQSYISTYSFTRSEFLTKWTSINSSSSLKIASAKNSVESNLQTFIQTADPLSKYQTTIWNTEGREISNRYLNISEIENFIKSNLAKFPIGIYYTRLVNDKHQTAFTGKINN
jgi:hypothetical protein